MRFLFFNAAGGILFERSDAESASVTHEEMTLQALFPYVPEKEILRGMRIGYEDALGVFQVFEIRKVRTLEPDHFQEVSAEHIAISELTDEVTQKKEITNKTIAEVLNSTDGLLTGTGWAIGTNTTSNTSSCDIATGDVWSATRTLQQNWNAYILPRITVGSAGITGKYLDVMPAGGTWRGFRLSLDKNANEIGVIWDDSKLKTALYAFGQEKNKTPLTFKDVVWTTSGGDPVNKPANQTYVEDPTATANYGRNGRPRFGYYQNASITDAATLLQKTWEVLQTVSVPDVTVNANVSDLHRLGYVDVPLRLHDTALIEIRPTGVILQKEIIQYTEDLLDPLQSRLTIGTYIPNIIYINRQNAKRGGGGGGSGDSQTSLEYTTENNTVQISIDSRGLQSLCVGTGAQLNPDGTLVVDPNTGYPVFIDGGENLWSNIQQNKSNISLEVTNRQNADSTLTGLINVEAGKISQIVTAVGSNGQVTAASIVAAVNSSGSSVIISADHIDLQGVVTADSLATDIADIETLAVQDLNATGDVSVGGDLSVYGDASFALGNTLTCGALACGNLDCDGISIGGSATVATNFIVSASVSQDGKTLTLTPLTGNPINFSKPGQGVITAITKSGQTWKPALYTHGGYEVGVYASGTNVGTYSSTVEVDAANAWSAGWVDGYDDCEAEFTSTTAYVEDSSGSYHLRGTSVNRILYGTLYDSGGAPMGTGSWYMVSANRTLPLYYGNGTTLASKTVYTRSSS